QTVLQKRIDGACRLDRELRVKLYRILQITQTLLEQCRHLSEARSRSESALARSGVFLFQERENGVRAVADVNLRVCSLELQNAIFEINFFQLHPEKNPVDALIFRPIVTLHRA